MNIERIVMELFDRVKTLEEKVEYLEKNNNVSTNVETKDTIKEIPIISRDKSLTQRTRSLIQSLKEEAVRNKEKSIILKSGDIQRLLGVSNRVPSICLAMRDLMQPGDIVLEEPPSGFSTRLVIEYKLNYLSIDNDDEDEIEDIKEEPSIMTLRQLRVGFENYFSKKKPDYKYPGPLFGMAFYITKHDIGVTLEDLFSKRVSLDEYGDILYDHFYEMKKETAQVRTSAYKDAMKNLLEYIDDMHFNNVIIQY